MKWCSIKWHCSTTVDILFGRVLGQLVGGQRHSSPFATRVLGLALLTKLLGSWSVLEVVLPVGGIPVPSVAEVLLEQEDAQIPFNIKKR